MACLNMQMNEQQQGGFLGPRISFSNDFVDSQQTTANLKNINTYREAPVSSEFEFSVPCFASNSADEMVFQTKNILPLKQKLHVTTLKDELLAANDDDDDDDDIFFPKSSGWWRFGKSQSLNNNGSLSTVKKGDHKNHGGLDTIDETIQYLRSGKPSSNDIGSRSRRGNNLMRRNIES